MKNGRYNFSEIKRIMLLINIVESEENKRLDLPIKKFVKAAGEFADREKTTKPELLDFITTQANEYARSEAGKSILVPNSNIIANPAESRLTIQMVINQFDKLFKCLVECSHPDKHQNITMKRKELIWPKIEYTMDNKSDKILTTDDFLDSCIKCTHVKRVDPNNIEQEDMVEESNNDSKDPNSEDTNPVKFLPFTTQK